MTFLGLGIPIMQGYGLTETSPVTYGQPALGERVRRGRDARFAGVEVRIADDGEVLVRGRNVMQGYYRDPQATAAAIVDGWLHTGDIGEIDASGFLAHHRPQGRDIQDRHRQVDLAGAHRGEHQALDLRRPGDGRSEADARIRSH